MVKEVSFMIKVENLSKEFKMNKKYPGFKGAIKSFFSREYTTKVAVDSINFEISNEEFRKVVSNVKGLYGKHIQISERNEDNIQSDYLLINSVGDFIITENMKDKKIYNIEEENYEILKKYL